MKKISTYALLLLLLIGAGQTQAQNADGSRLKFAVYVTGMKDGQQLTDVDEEMNSAHGTASDVMINSGLYEMIERSQAFLKQIREEQKYQQSGVVEDKQIAEIGKANGAQKICVVQLTIRGSGLLVVARIVDVERETASQSGREQVNNYTGWLDVGSAVEKAITKILGISGTTPATNRPAISYGTGTDRSFTVNGVSFKMVFVKGGSMYLGCTSGSGSCESDESPSHNVTLSDYYMGETEVTQALWKAVMGYNNNPSNWQGDRLPVEKVTWTDCDEFVSRLNSLLAAQLPQGYRFALPSEAQWEYAARGGQKSSGSMYAGSGNVGFVAWYYDNSGSRTHEVKLKAPNELGLYDMSGNVWEWCEDWYSSSWYSDNRNWTDPVNTYVGSNRVLRGGSWLSYASHCRVANRSNGSPSYRYNSSGFRLALVHR